MLALLGVANKHCDYKFVYNLYLFRKMKVNAYLNKMEADDQRQLLYCFRCLSKHIQSHLFLPNGSLVKICNNIFYSDGLVVNRASASRYVNLGLFPRRVKLMTLKLVYTALLLNAEHLKESVESTRASLLVVPFEKALGGVPHATGGRPLQSELSAAL